MQISIQHFSKLYRHLRIDAEFYQPKYLTLDSLLKNKGSIFPLRKYCNYIKKGIFDISPELYKPEGIPLIRTSEIKNLLLNFATTIFLDTKTHKKNFKTELAPDDIVMTKIGAYIGDVAILPNRYDKYNFSQNVTGLSINDNIINPKFLFAFLQSGFGRSQIMRITMLSGQGKIELEDIRDISVYEASSEFQRQIARIIELAQSKISEAKNVYKKTKNLLLIELGLHNWYPEHQLTFIKNYSDTGQVGRIDAEYFQPKYDDIINTIKTYNGGWDTLESLVTLKNSNFTPGDTKTYQYIELANITDNGEITDCTTDEGQNLPARARRRVNIGDVIVSSIEGSLSSIAIIEEEYDDSLCSTGFHVINSKHLNSETLLVLLKSLVGQLQLKKGCNGTILTAINQEEFSKIILPNITQEKQREIQKKVTESFALRKQSKQLLENAKQAVEIAIEQDENTAIEWLKSA